jgi:hypothetical protein
MQWGVWDVHVQWLTQARPKINGQMADYDWLNPDDTRELDSLTTSEVRWNEGQMLELEVTFRCIDLHPYLPMEIWPVSGFKYQRFNMTAYDTTVHISPDYAPGTFFPGDIITFNQQYYVAYLGTQLRGVLNPSGFLPVNLTFQVDGGLACGFGVDHHLLREGDLYSIQNTQGGAFHLALTGEVALTQHISLGAQFDHMEIRTVGTEFYVNKPLGDDESWNNGVKADSDQSMLSVFVRAHF